MKVVGTPAELDAALGTRRAAGTIGLVPTMGALHGGHRALLESARARSGAMVVSIFVNPLQFGPGEDLATYPRRLDDDLAMCAAEGVDVVFAPDVATVYPDGKPAVTVDPGRLGDELEGASRPDHFRGVLTVVVKLFGLVRPDLAVFGTKDFQQLTLVRRCVRDLSLPVAIVGVETVRDSDGLALSSRNAYLSTTDRVAALGLGRALAAGREAGDSGPAAVLAAAHRAIDDEAGLSVDYLELRDEHLGPTPQVGPARLLVAARVGTTRLIDNTRVVLGEPEGGQP